MRDATVKIGEGGRVVIPIECRKELGLDIGDELLLHVDNGKIVLFTRKQALLYVQEELAKYSTNERQLSEEVIEDRRREAKNE
jgi:AbrB family looped-hinge helix DNA binding protein